MIINLEMSCIGITKTSLHTMPWKMLHVSSVVVADVADAAGVADAVDVVAVDAALDALDVSVVSGGSFNSLL